ncbi:MAG: ABC transporter permease [Kiritimatiellaeota bacterium]|nr:ABC transporter permease [Kiritimatiellota bacterium]
MLNRIRCLLIKELTQIRRDPRLFGILIMAPIIQLVVMGFATNTDIREIALAIRDNDRSFHSREYIRALAASGYFRVAALPGPVAGDARQLVAGRAGLVLVIPPGFGRQLVRRAPATVQALVDGADSNFGMQGVNYLNQATRLFSARFAREVAVDARLRGLALPAVAAETRVWYNPELTSRYYMVPALMGVLLLVTTMLVSSMALVKEREEGTMEQLIVTPLRPMEIILGKLLPFVVIGFAEVTLALPLMRLIFGVPLRGSVLLLYALSGVFLLTTLGLGLFVSTLVRTQQQAMLIAAFFVMMPFILLSGFIFPVENMPPAFQVVAQFIPLKYYLTIIRGIFLKGVGWHALWRDGLILLAWGVGILSLAALKFHKRLD